MKIYFQCIILFLLFSLLVPFSVGATEYCAQYNPINVPSKINSEKCVYVQVNVTNCGSIKWAYNNPYRYFLHDFWYIGNTKVKKGLGRNLVNVNPGQSQTIPDYQLCAPHNEGNYTLKWDIEYFTPGGNDRTLFSAIGVPTMDQNIVVKKLQALPRDIKMPAQSLTEAASSQLIYRPPIMCSIEHELIKSTSPKTGKLKTTGVHWKIKVENKTKNEISFVTATLKFYNGSSLTDTVQKKFRLNPFGVVGLTHDQNTANCLPVSGCVTITSNPACKVDVSFPGGEDAHCEKSIHVQ